MIYFDHGATSFPKPKTVMEEMEKCMKYYLGNPGRSGHKMSMMMGEKIYETRKDAASLLGIHDPSRILFTKNTTEALNLAIQGLLKEGDHVVTTSMEHNSMLRPLSALKKRGISHTIVKANRQGQVSVSALKDAIQKDTKLIAVTAASNITGTILPLKEIGALAKAEGIPFLVDGAQLAGKGHIHVEDCGINLLAFPGHKGLLGPPGTGGLYVSPEIRLEPLLYGGTGTMSKKRTQPKDLPEGFEAGTLNGLGIIGLGQGIRVIEKIGIETIAFQERALISRFEELVGNMEDVICYGPAPSDKTGICLFNIKGMESEEVTERLSREYDIAVRGGFHCAGLAHETIGTGEKGAVRLSVGLFNTRKEIYAAADAIWRLSRNI